MNPPFSDNINQDSMIKDFKYAEESTKQKLIKSHDSKVDNGPNKEVKGVSNVIQDQI